jgi:hypothetical protein
MLNESEKIYLRDTDTYIYSDAAGSITIVGTSITLPATVIPNYNEGFTMLTTKKIQFRDTGLYIYSSTDGTLNVVADTVLALASTTITLTGAITVTGAPTITGNVAITGTVGITGAVTMATTNKIQFYDSGAYIQASASTALAIAATSIAIAGATDHTGVFEMQTTSKLQFRDTGLYIYSSIDGQLDIVADTTLALAATSITLTGAATITGAVGIDGDVTMATTDQINFYDDGAYIQATASTALAIVGTTIALTGAMTFTGAVSQVGAITMATTSKLQFHDTGMYIYASGDGALAIVSDTTLGITCPAITITATTALTMASTSKIQFLDTGLYIYSSANGVLDIVSDTTLKLTAPAITITGAPTITGALTVGVNDTGHDVKFFGATDGSYLLWDESDDRLEFVNAKVEIGTTGSPTAVLYNGTQVLQIYTTCASTTDTGFGQQIIKNVMTGAGQSVEGFQVTLESDVKLGTYANAACIRADWKDNGGVAGLGSVLCLEMVMAASAMEGTFGILELEASCPASWTGVGPIAFLYMNAYGDTVANFDDYACVLRLTGVTAGAAHIWQTGNTLPATVGGSLKIMVENTEYFIPVYTSVVTTT